MHWCTRISPTRRTHSPFPSIVTAQADVGRSLSTRIPSVICETTTRIIRSENCAHSVHGIRWGHDGRHPSDVANANEIALPRWHCSRALAALDGRCPQLLSANIAGQVEGWRPKCCAPHRQARSALSPGRSSHLTATGF